MEDESCHTILLKQQSRAARQSVVQELPFAKEDPTMSVPTSGLLFQSPEAEKTVVSYIQIGDHHSCWETVSTTKGIQAKRYGRDGPTLDGSDLKIQWKKQRCEWLHCDVGRDRVEVSRAARLIRIQLRAAGVVTVTWAGLCLQQIADLQLATAKACLDANLHTNKPSWFEDQIEGRETVGLS